MVIQSFLEARHRAVGFLELQVPWPYPRHVLTSVSMLLRQVVGHIRTFVPVFVGTRSRQHIVDSWFGILCMVLETVLSSRIAADEVSGLSPVRVHERAPGKGIP